MLVKHDLAQYVLNQIKCLGGRRAVRNDVLAPLNRLVELSHRLQEYLVEQRVSQKLDGLSLQLLGIRREAVENVNDRVGFVNLQLH